MIIEDKQKHRYISNPLDTAYLKVRNFKIIFPSGYQFVLKVPQQINVFQITEIIRNYTILHRTYGLKVQGVSLEPMFLSSTNKNLIIDAYMSSQNSTSRQMGLVTQNQFKVEYSLRDCNLSKCPARNYQILGKLQKKETKQTLETSECIMIARNRINCQLYGLTKMNKKNLSFNECQKIVLLISYLKRAVKHQNNQFSEFYECFQTEKSLYIVKKFNPFLLSKLKIEDKFLMDLVLSQIARTFHILQRDQIQIDTIQLCDFWMDFRLQLRLFDIEKLSFRKNKPSLIRCQEEQSKIGQRGTIFNKKMVQMLEDLFQNCHLKIIELYIPLFHWLKNNRINNYLQFLKYSQIEPNWAFSASNSAKITQITSNLMINYSSDHIITQIDENQSQQLKNDYQSKTKIFHFSSQIIKDSLQQKTQEQKKCAQLNGNEILEDITTIKKKSRSKFAESKPNQYHLKKKKKKNKSKEREKQKSLSTNQKLKTQKRKKENKIFEFLSED